MACEPLSVLILSTCLIAFWPCVLPLCFAVPILPYPMYFAKNDTQDVSESNENNENIKTNADKRKKGEANANETTRTNADKRKKPGANENDENVRTNADKRKKPGANENGENVRTNADKKKRPDGHPYASSPDKEDKEFNDDDEYSDDAIGPSKGTLAPEKKLRRGKARFDGSNEDLDDDSEEECCTNINCKDKNMPRERDYDMDCEKCGRNKANLYYDSEGYRESESENDEIIMRPRRKPKMVNKKTKTTKITKKGSGDRCCCSHKRFGRTVRKEDQLYCLTSKDTVQ